MYDAPGILFLGGCVVAVVFPSSTNNSLGPGMLSFAFNFFFSSEGNDQFLKCLFTNLLEETLCYLVAKVTQRLM